MITRNISFQASLASSAFHKWLVSEHHNLLIGLTHWQHPSFFAYFPAACTFEGILGDLYSSSITNPGFNVSLPLIASFILF